MSVGIRNRIPNSLTLSRLGLGLVFPMLPVRYWLPALIWGAVSEFLDGYLSRRWQAVTAFGKLLDPIADKIFVLAMLLTFLDAGLIGIGGFFLLTIRDLFVISALAIVWMRYGTGQQIDLGPAKLGKWTTAFQLTCLFDITFFGRANPYLLFFSGLVGFAAAIEYARRFPGRK